MSYALFSLTPRPSALEIKNGAELNRSPMPEEMYVLHNEIHVRKMSGFLYGSIRRSDFLTALAVVCMMFTWILGFTSSRWYFILTAVEYIGMVGCVRADIDLVGFYMDVLQFYVYGIFFFVFGIAIASAEPAPGVKTDEMTVFLKSALAPYCESPYFAIFLFVVGIVMQFRCNTTCKHFNFVYFTRLFSKLKTQRYILEAC